MIGSVKMTPQEIDEQIRSLKLQLESMQSLCNHKNVIQKTVTFESVPSLISHRCLDCLKEWVVVSDS